jgi:hypothetical protein
MAATLGTSPGGAVIVPMTNGCRTLGRPPRACTSVVQQDWSCASPASGKGRKPTFPSNGSNLDFFIVCTWSHLHIDLIGIIYICSFLRTRETTCSA